MEEKDMPAVVQLVAARLRSHPEEYRAWKSEIGKIDEYLSTDERAVIKEAMRSAALEAAHKSAMKRILDGGKEDNPVKDAYFEEAKWRDRAKAMGMAQRADVYAKHQMIEEFLRKTRP